MKNINLCGTAYTAALLMALGACSSSDSDNVIEADAGSQDAPEDLQTSDTSLAAPVVTPIDDPINDPVSEPVSEPINDPVSDPIDDPVETPESDPDEDPIDEPGEDPVVLTPPAAPSIEIGSDPEETQSVDPESETAVILDPQAEPGSDLDRLFSGLTRQASITLLDLNQRISQGQTLSDLEAQCLGSFEEGLGAPLLAIDCGDDNFLATGEIELFASKASFYDTPVCSAAVFDGNSDGCVLRELILSVSTNFEIPEGANLPVPVFPGSLLDYAVDNSQLLIQNVPSAPTGPFLCNVNLETVQLSATASTENCDDIIELVADEIERLQGL